MYKDEVSYRNVKNGIGKKTRPREKTNLIWFLEVPPHLPLSGFPFLLKYVDGVVVHRVNCPDPGDKPGDSATLFSISAGWLREHPTNATSGEGMIRKENSKVLLSKRDLRASYRRIS